MKNHVLSERECIHRHRGVEGEFYLGTTYVEYLQRLRSDAAVQAARKVTPFFWSDAAQIIVWLCRDCAKELRLPHELGFPEEPPRHQHIQRILQEAS
jgi:hypothetical protein